ncbi:MAG: DNA adenine methylase, partial [Christensenellaceae bacterium]
MRGPHRRTRVKIANYGTVSWVGNKSSILAILYAVFPNEYGRFIDVFGGSGSV